MPADLTSAEAALDAPEFRRVVDLVAERARALDLAEVDLRDDLSELAELDLFDVEARPLSEVSPLVEALGGESLTVAFGAWAQRMTAEYLRIGADRSDVARELYESVASGARPGVTGMAAAQRQAVGLGDVPMVATPDGDGYILSGPIAWASNVYEDSVMVLSANTPDHRSLVIVVRASDPGVTIRKAPKLLALDATASTMLQFDDVRVPAERVLGDDLPEFLVNVRPQFLLLQTAFCIGIAGRALKEAEPRLGGLGEFYATDHAKLVEEHERLHRLLADQSADPAGQYMQDLLQLRLDGVELAVGATRLEMSVSGGMGYAQASAANRRFREATFLPVQSPTQAQLNWELDRLNEVNSWGPVI